MAIKKEVDPAELQICKVRGHKTSGLSDERYWSQCQYCGLWLRTKKVMEERADAPPEDECNPFDRVKRAQQ